MGRSKWSKPARVRAGVLKITITIGLAMGILESIKAQLHAPI